MRIQAVRHNSETLYGSFDKKTATNRSFGDEKRFEVSEDLLILGFILVGLLVIGISIGVWLFGRLFSTPNMLFFMTK